jgi:hypothetical protein
LARTSLVSTAKNTMSHHHEHQSKGLEEHMHGAPPQRQDRKLHRDWRIWLGVILMLAAMAIYLLTMDEAVVPGGPSAGNLSVTNAPTAP